MENLLYLLSITVSGIKSIKDEVRLDFYKKTIDKKFNPEKYRIKAIYGENGSGKSALITAVKIFKDLIEKNNYLNETANQSILKEVINKKTQQFTFGCEFSMHASDAAKVYRYNICLGLNSDGIYGIKSETLESKNGSYANNNYQLLFETRDGEIKYVNESEEDKYFLTEKTKNLLFKTSFVCLVIDQIKNLGEKEEYSPLIMGIVFCKALVMFMKIYLEEKDQHELYFLTKSILEQDYLRRGDMTIASQIYKNMIEFSGVNDEIIKKDNYDLYKEAVGRLTKFVKIFKSDLIDIEIDKKDNGEYYKCELILNYGGYKVNKEFESTGIKKLIRLYECFAVASKNGIVFIDELDSNLNDIYLCKLIEYFMYYGKGQLCFTTHNLDPMQVLKENKNSIDFLSSDNHIVSWTSRGNSSPDNCYRNGLIENSPFHVDATDFIGILGD